MVPDDQGGFFEINLSNTALEPQHAMQIELGTRSQVEDVLHRGDLAEVDLSIYAMQAEDEIGFDLGSFSYANLGRTDHRGIELTTAYSPAARLRVDAGYSWTRAEFGSNYTSGDVTGKQINNVPKHSVRAGVDYSFKRASLRMSVRHVRRQYADEANEVPIPDYTVVDLKGSFSVAAEELYVRIHNLLDASYSPAGYVGPGSDGAPIALFYPAPGRGVDVGLRIRL